jgi:hypothetical protein
MLAKMEAALGALRGGVQRVRIAAIEAIAVQELGTTVALTIPVSEDLP